MVIISDDLQQNTTFVNNQEVIIVESNSDTIEETLISLINNPKVMIEIATTGKLKFQEIYSNKVQMNPRTDILKKFIASK